MKITCPSCDTSYDVNPEQFPADGKSVRCARCKTVWHAVAYSPEMDLLPPEAESSTAIVAAAATNGNVQPAVGATIVDDGGEAAEDRFDIEHAAASRARLAANRAGKGPRVRYKGAGAKTAQAFVFGCCLAIVVAAVHYRQDVVRALPSSAGLYEMAGLPVNLRGLEFTNVTQRRDFEDGVPVLIVEGDIENVRDRATAVPALRFSLRGRGDDEIYAWTLEPRQRVVDPDGSMHFRTRLASPPRGAENLQIRFTERDRRIVELTN